VDQETDTMMEDSADAPAETLEKLGADRLIAMLDPEVLGNVSVELTATLGSGKMTMHRLASLATGEVLSLDTPINGTVELSLNGIAIARGEIVAVGDQFGVRITDILARKA
jgi:flagellar motor switch protein FliN